MILFFGTLFLFFLGHLIALSVDRQMILLPIFTVSCLLRCMEEFFKQGDKEQEQGLDFSPLCDRQNTMVPQSQIGMGEGLFCALVTYR